MKIFVWKSYGDISVYAFDTPEQQSALKKSIVEVLQQEGSEIDESSSWQKIYGCIEDQQLSGSDNFEYGTGRDTLIFKE